MIGPGGAGKSHIAQELGKRTGLPVTHMDVLAYQPGWESAPRDERVGKLANIVARAQWIIEGNFLKDVDQDGRFRRADTVIFLDLPRRVCLWRVWRRLVRDRSRRRVDLPDGCPESWDPQGYRWIWRYRHSERPRVLSMLRQLDASVAVHRLGSTRDVRKFLATQVDLHS